MNKKYEYITGNIYGILKLKEVYRNDKNRLTALTECVKCGKQKILRASDLYNTKSNSCSCQSKKHNYSGTKIYSIYHNIKDRCFNQKNHAYDNYGGRGIKMCDLWLDDFLEFKNWSDKNGYMEGLSIDRIDVNGDYEPDNCRWVTLSENVAFANKHNARRKANKGRYYGYSPKGEYYEFDNANEFARLYNLNAGCVRAVANGRKNTHKQWKFGFVNEK